MERWRSARIAMATGRDIRNCMYIAVASAVHSAVRSAVRSAVHSATFRSILLFKLFVLDHVALLIIDLHSLCNCFGAALESLWNLWNLFEISLQSFRDSLLIAS
jgi:hypothetical protein